MSIKRFLYKYKVKSDDRAHLSEIINIEKKYNKLYSKADEHLKDMLSIGYIGLAYEYFLLDASDFAMECMNKLDKRNLVHFLEVMKKSTDNMIVGFIVYDYIKDIKAYKENYFFKIFEVGLLDFKFPVDYESLPEKFITSWVKVKLLKNAILE